MIDEGDVVLTPLPQSDGRMKNRPALVLRRMPPFGDFLVCGISTQLHHAVEGFDEFIDAADADYASSGLKAASLIRVGYLAVLPPGSFLGKIGSVSSERRSRLLLQLCRHLCPEAMPTAS
jgi:mRNA interferase MazF